MVFPSENFDTQKFWMYGILLAVSAMAVWVFSEVIWTVFLAVTFVYVLYPLTQKLEAEGFSRRQSSITATFIAFLTILLLALPFILVLHRRRDIFIEFLQGLPQNFEISVLDFDFTIQTTELIEIARTTITDTAVNLAQILPSIGLKTLLAMTVVYATLRNKDKIENIIVSLVPNGLEKTIYSYNKKIDEVVTGLYVVQLSTAVLTFLIGLPVFYFLGYEPFISLALIAGILQLIPVLGPTILIVALAGFELIIGEIAFAITVLLIGLGLIALLPDLIVRPQLADYTTGISPSLYLLGFIGGILKLGAIGIIVGPLVIALFIQTVRFLPEQNSGLEK